MTISMPNMIQRLSDELIKNAVKAGCFVAFVGFLGISAHPVAGAGKVARPFLSADVDGDGKKDSFYRTYLPGRQIEFGVRLTNSNNKYIKIFDGSIKDFNEMRFGVENRKEFIEEIRCSGRCSPTRIEGTAALERSKSPEIVHVYWEEVSGSAIFMNEKGKITQEWYSD